MIASTLRASVLVGAYAVVASCGSAGDQAKQTSPQPPGSKQAIRALFATHDASLSVHESCANAGSEFGDSTIGDYIAGLMSEMTKTTPMGRNTVSAACQPAGPDAWQCTVEMGRQDGENEWVRGVAFRMSQAGRVQSDSIRCTGGG